MQKLTKKQYEVLSKHIIIDISYGTGGTFYTGDDGEKFDRKEAKIAKKALAKIRAYFVQ